MSDGLEVLLLKYLYIQLVYSKIYSGWEKRVEFKDYANKSSNRKYRYIEGGGPQKLDNVLSSESA